MLIDPTIGRTHVANVNKIETIKGDIALISTGSGLQTGLLAKLIRTEMNTRCDVFSSIKDLPNDFTIAIIDCTNVDIETLKDTARGAQERKQSLTVALLNAHYESEHEELLDWPCVMGIFYTDTDEEQLFRGLNCLIEGDYWVPRRLLHHFLERNRRAPNSATLSSANLTKREREILKMIKTAATNADISEALSVSEHTVKSHLYNVYRKIGVRNRLEAGNWLRSIDDVGNIDLQ